MKKILLLSSLRTGSSFLVDNITLSIQKQYNQLPLTRHYKVAEHPPSAEVLANPLLLLKISWFYHLGHVGDLSQYDAVFLKRKDKFAQCLSMATAHDHPAIPFNIYKDTAAQWDQWTEKQESLYISKSAFCIAFWGRESLEKNVMPYLSKFKTSVSVDYEDIDQNIDNVVTVLNKLELPDHCNHDHNILPIRRNWDKWSNIANKDEVLSWAEELFPQEGYTIDKRYYTK